MTTPGFLRQNARWLGAGGLLAFSGSYGQTFFIAIFAGDIQDSFGLSHGAWGAIYALGTLGSAAVMVWLGTLTDHYRVRRLGPWALAGLAAACLAMAVNPWVWALPLVVFGLRLGGQGMVTHVGRVAMARWFSANRGKAISVSSLGYSVGEALLPILFVALLTVVEWRALWGLAALLSLAAIPVLLALLHRERQPQSYAEDSQSTGSGGRHWTRAEVVRAPFFWAIVPALLSTPAFVTAFFFQQVHLAAEKDIAHLDLVALFPLYSVVSVLAMLGTGFLVDRFGTRLLMCLFTLPLALSFIVISGTETLLGLAVGLSLLAVTVGANNTLPAAFWADMFGTRHLGAIKSVAMALMVLSSAIGPLITSLAIDAGASFPAQMPLISLYIALSTGLLAAALWRTRA
ncbi:MFS transporter [Dinoroseobacter sp. PD6]|uniref:MFS transporter n=1 Tax=Dinoroseobacter sp. PD6 TaxID=3028384 RepID=UPI00237BCCC3|nr:MFS transporter [Dinoroseobacter sp. PD6]MDD9718106.1 MFS transporter [Dinoroseobacter sp. PD6]